MTLASEYRFPAFQDCLAFAEKALGVVTELTTTLPCWFPCCTDESVEFAKM